MNKTICVESDGSRLAAYQTGKGKPNIPLPGSWRFPLSDSVSAESSCFLAFVNGSVEGGAADAGSFCYFLISSKSDATVN